MKFKDFFDTNYHKHIEAYKCYQMFESWPEGFDFNVDQSDKIFWPAIAKKILAEAWITHFEWKNRAKTEFIPE